MADDYGSSTSNAGMVSVGRSRTGSIETSGDTDWFRVTLTAGATYRFDLEGAATDRGTLADPFLRLRDGWGNSITANDNGGSGLNARIGSFTPTSSGTYYLSVGSSNNGTGTYRLKATETSPPPVPDDYGSTASSAGTIAVGNSRTAAIEKSGDTDWFKTTLLAGRTYQVDVEGADTDRGTLADPYGSIRDAAGNKVEEANDGGTGDNTRFTWTVPDNGGGTYYIAAGSNNNGSGSYRVRLTEVTASSSATTYSVTASASSVNEGRQLTFTITRSGDKPAETLYFSTLADGTAKFADGDYTLAGGGEPKNVAVRFSAGKTTETVTLDIRSDGIADAGERFRAILQRDDGDPVGDFIVRTDFVTITEGAQNTTYSLTPSSTTVSEGGQVVFTITRSGDKPGERIFFSAWQDSAKYSDGDYRLSTGGEPRDHAVDFRSGETTKTVTLSILQDGVADGGERFRAILQGNPPASSPADNIAVTGYITIDEGTPPALPPDGDDFRDDATDMSAPFGDVTVGGSKTGIIGAADANDRYGDKDVFRVDLVQGQAYQVRLTSTAVDGAGALPSGLFTVRSPGNFDSVIEASGAGSNVSRTFVADTTASYYIRVGTGDLASDQGGYRLSVANVTPSGGADDFADFPGDSGAVAGLPTLSMGPAKMGVIESPGDTDAFTVTLQAGRRYHFSLESYAAGGFGSLAHVYMTLRSGSNFDHRIDGNGGAGQTTMTFAPESSGLYYIRVGSGSSGTGGYRLDVVDRGAVPSRLPDLSSADGADAYNRWFDGHFFDATGLLSSAMEAKWAYAKDSLTKSGASGGAKIAGHMQRTFGAAGFAMDFAQAMHEINKAENEQQWYRAAFVQFGTMAVGGAVVAAGTLLGGPVGGFATSVVWTAGLDQAVEKKLDGIYSSLFGGTSAASLETAFSSMSFADLASNDEGEFTPVFFDEEWYLAQHPGVADAVASGAVGSGYAHFITIGIDLGYKPNATQSVARSDLAFSVVNNDPAAIGSSAVLTYPLSRYAADGISPTETAVFQSIQAARGSVGGLAIDATLSAIANRKATDLVANFPTSAAMTAHIESSPAWAEAWSNGSALTQQFGAAFDALLGVEPPVGSYAMFVVSSPEASAAAVLSWLQTHHSFGPAMSNAAFDTIGIAEFGGVWVVIVADRSPGYAVTAPSADSLAATVQYGGDELDVLYAGTRPSKLYGLGGNDHMMGSAGNDRLDGGAGDDYMDGGAGDDTYFVDQPGDSVIERTAQGNDRVVASVSYTLGAGIETLAADGEGGTAALVLAGNELDNAIFGNAGDNTLWGMGGNDRLTGFGGDDIYVLESAGDVVVEAAGQGRDWAFTSVSYTLAVGSEVEGLTAHDRTLTVARDLTGNEIKNFIFGNAGANRIDGGGGADYLDGGAGDDIYLVDDSHDYVVERAGEGDDRILTSVAYSLAGGVHVELLAANYAAGAAGIVLAGNELDNALLGGTGADTLWGLGGNDRLTGLQGNDSYVVDSAGDMVVEAADEGQDRVFSLVSFVLPAAAEVELLSVLSAESTDAVDLTGNGFDQSIFGNAGANMLAGAGGDDYLHGGAGGDRLRGGSGNDAYHVNDMGDIVEELAGEGADRVFAAANYVLTAGSEIEILSTADEAGTAPIALTGNERADRIIGNGGANILSGGDGDDRLEGLGGDDTFVMTGTSAGGGPRSLTLQPGAEGQDLWVTNVYYGGGADDEVLKVGGWGDVYKSLIRFDLAAGGLPASVGSAVLRIYNSGANGGTPTGFFVDQLSTGWSEAYRWSHHSLADTSLAQVAAPAIGWVEIDVTQAVNAWLANPASNYGLQLRPTNTNNNFNIFVSSDATGDNGSRRPQLVFNWTAPATSGPDGDTAIGGAGDDVYILDSAADRVVELAGEGADEIRTALSAYSLEAIANVENLTGTSAAGQVLTGNGLGNVLFGGMGDDVLNGLAGNDMLIGFGGFDTLRGQAGDDVYIIDAADTIVELAGDGFDEVRTQAEIFVLADTLENLRANSDIGHDFRGNQGSNVIVGGDGKDIIRAQDGGGDLLFGKAGIDSFYFGGAFDNGDYVDGGDGRDTILLQGNHDLTLTWHITGATSIANVEEISLLSGAVTTYGLSGASLYSYRLRLVDGNVAAGQVLNIDGSMLGTGENMTIDASAETDGLLQIFGGLGRDVLTGGARNDAFVFGHDGRFAAGDAVNGGGGDDIVYLRGDYRIDFGAAAFAGALTNVESIVLLGSDHTELAAGGDGDFDYWLTWSDTVLGAGAAMTVDATGLRAHETFIFDGVRETDGLLNLSGGEAGDTLIGGAGSDQLHGGGGADLLRGGAGADLFRYSAAGDSVLGASDTIEGFVAGQDRIDLNRIDAKASTTAENEAFAFIGAAAFSGGGPGASGEVRAVFISGSLWRIEADVNGDARADLFIEVYVAGGQALTSAEFIL
jgi:Ca2+-binding RTX toxin-like protein